MKRTEFLPALIGIAVLVIVTGCAFLAPTLDDLTPTEETTLFPEEWLIKEETTAVVRGHNGMYKSAMPCEIAYDIKKQPKSPAEVETENEPSETTEAGKRAEFDGCAASQTEGAYEPETSEESSADRVLEETAEPDGYRVAGEGSVEAAPTAAPVAGPPAVETAPEVPAPVQDEPAHDVHEMGLEQALRSALVEAGIGDLYIYCWAQVQQESHWNPNSVSADGKDYGLLQYRLQFWDGPGDIMDPYAQIQKYVGQVKARVDAGLSIEEIISRHMTSDYVTEINWDYVNLVLSHLNQ